MKKWNKIDDELNIYAEIREREKKKREVFRD